MQCVRATSTAAMFVLLGTMVPAYAQRDQQDQKQGKSERQQGRQQQGAPPAAQQQRTQRQAQQPQARSQQQQQRQSAQQPQQQRVQQSQPQQRQQQQRVQQTQPQQRQGSQQVYQQQLPQQRQSPQQAYQQRRPQRSQQQAMSWQQQRGWLRQGGWQGNTTWQQGRARRWDSEHRTWAQRGGYGGYYIPQDRFSLYFGRQHWFRIYSRPTFYMGYPRFSYGGFSFLLLDPWPEYWQENWYATDDVYVDYDDGYYLYNRRYPSARLAITVVM